MTGLEPELDKKYCGQAQRIHRDKVRPEGPTMKTQEDRLEDHLEAHQEEATQDQANQGEKTLT